MGFFNHFLNKNFLNKNRAFVWKPQTKSFRSILNINAIDLSLIIGVDRQKKQF